MDRPKCADCEWQHEELVKVCRPCLVYYWDRYCTYCLLPTDYDQELTCGGCNTTWHPACAPDRLNYEGFHLCTNCADEEEWIHLCEVCQQPVCGNLHYSGFTCQDCADRFHYECIYRPGYYRYEEHQCDRCANYEASESEEEEEEAETQ